MRKKKGEMNEEKRRRRVQEKCQEMNGAEERKRVERFLVVGGLLKWMNAVSGEGTDAKLVILKLVRSKLLMDSIDRLSLCQIATNGCATYAAIYCEAAQQPELIMVGSSIQ